MSAREKVFSMAESRECRKRRVHRCALLMLSVALGLTMIWTMLPPRTSTAPETDLMLAASSCNLVELRSVLREHTDDGIIGRSELSAALRMAAMYGHDVILEELLSRGADVNARDGHGNTALFMAVIPCEGCDEVARRLIRAGALVDARDHEQRTPLIDAAERGNLAVLKVLLAAGADPSAVDAHRHTASELARANGHHEILEQLDGPMSYFDEPGSDPTTRLANRR
jgi:uncharacterized protein